MSVQSAGLEEHVDRLTEERPIRLIAGLGNPGPRYQNNRHNVGFRVVELLASGRGKQFESRLTKSLSCVLTARNGDVVLIKPQTYMNRSGAAIRELLQSVQAEPAELLVVYDDEALPLGDLRIRRSGSAGGQKGMQSIIDALGTRDIPRLRIGIGAERKPKDLSEYVLSDFTRAERRLLEEVLSRAVQAIDVILAEGLEPAMSRFN